MAVALLVLRVQQNPNSVRHAVTIFRRATKPSANFRAWDPRYPDVVASLVAAVGERPAGVTLEHVGSTSIPGCGGKGVIDLIALYPAGALETAKTWLFSLGLITQGPEFARAWGDTRPMYLGSYVHDHEPFLVYVHVVCALSDEVRRFRDFRQTLSSSPALVEAYVTLKHEILADGVTDTDEYSVRKRPFMRQVLGDLHHLNDLDDT
jgi:GrpB-like predicted nucleotidyltransferase (UPF0157 family)